MNGKRTHLAVVTVEEPRDSPKNRGSLVDWESFTTLLLEQCEKPAMLLSRDGFLASCNRAAESLLGWSRDELRGKPWEHIGRGDDHTPFPVDDVLAGTITGLDVICRGADGESLVLSLDLSAVGDAHAGGILVVIRRSTVYSGTASPVSAGLYYEIVAEPARLGALKRVWGASRGWGTGATGERCHRALYGREEPCAKCPVFASSDPTGATTVLPPTPESAVVRILSVGCGGDDTYCVSSLSVRDSLLRELVAARIETMADDNELSPRERDVLRYLLLGRNVSEIGLILGISPRTVRYHQSNLLDKVGADSRMDLLRLIL